MKVGKSYVSAVYCLIGCSYVCVETGIAIAARYGVGCCVVGESDAWEAVCASMATSGDAASDDATGWNQVRDEPSAGQD